jgi:hypothetical protein
MLLSKQIPVNNDLRSRSPSHSQNQEQPILVFLTSLQDTLQDFLCNSLIERPSLLPSLLRLLRACLRFRHIYPSSGTHARRGKRSLLTFRQQWMKRLAAIY